MKILPEPVSFEWDKGNVDKNLIKHKVTSREIEEVFSNKEKFIIEDEKHSLFEKRYLIWGTTNIGRRLSIIFTLRDSKVRVISTRDMNKKERREYEKVQKSSKI